MNPSDTNTRSREDELYCNLCDENHREWREDHDGEPMCPNCFDLLYDSKEAYIDEMVSWLAETKDMGEQEVKKFLIEHGNPGKGQVLAILRQ